MGTGTSVAASHAQATPRRSGSGQGRMLIQVRTGGRTSEPVAVHYNRGPRGRTTAAPAGPGNTTMPMPTPYANYDYGQQRHESEYEQFDYNEYMVSQDTSRDLTLSRIMAADEFLQRMEDTEETVRNLIIVPENREAHFPRMMELLGLRGHLQDELLRIQKMLVQDDPELTCLKQFEVSHGRVVGVIKQLTVDKKTLNAEDFAAQYGLNIASSNSPREASEITVNVDSRGGEQGTTTASQSSSQGTGSTQTGAPPGVSMGTQADGVANEADLKKKHDQEENIVAKKFSERLLPKRGQMSKQEVDTLLEDHLKSMHLLRKKQDIEKLRLEEKLAAKRRQRQTIKEENEAKDAWSSVTELQGSRSGSAAQLVQLSTAAGTAAYHTPPGDEVQKQQQGGKPHGVATRMVRDETEAESDEDFDKLKKIVDDQEKEKEELREKDRAFATSVGNKRLGDQQYEDMLRKHMLDSDEIRKRRQADRDRLTQKLKDKLRSRKNAEFGEYESDEASDEGDDDMDNKMETEMKLQALRKKYQNELNSKGKQLTGKELEELLERYRQEQEEILRQRNRERSRTDAKLQEKLAARRRAKRGDQQEEDEDEGLDIIDYDGDEFDSDSEDDEEEKENTNAELSKTLQAEIWSNRKKMTSEDLKSMLDEFRNHQNEMHQMRDAAKGKHKQGLLAKLLERKQKKAAACDQGYEDEDSVSRGSLSPEPEEALLLGFTKENRKEIQSRDEDFVRNLSKRIKNMDEKEFARLLQEHLAQADEIRKKQLAERERLNQKLREKLRNMKKANGEPYSSDEDDEPEDTTAEEQLDVELQKLGSDFQSDITKKKSQLSDVDLQEFLRKHREDQEELMKRRLSQKARTDAALKKKLTERRQRGKELSLEASGIDDEFLQHLLTKQKNGELTEDMLADMLRNYLNNLDSAKKKEKQERRERRDREKKEEKENAMQTASSIVQDHHEKKKHFHDMRKREKSVLDEKLKRKLSAQRRKRLKEEVVPFQDNSF